MLDETTQERGAERLSVGQWMLTLFLTALPLVGLIMLLVWAFGNDKHGVRTNWAKAMLIWMVIFLVIYILGMLLFGATLLAWGEGMQR